MIDSLPTYGCCYVEDDVPSFCVWQVPVIVITAHPLNAIARQAFLGQPQIELRSVAYAFNEVYSDSLLTSISCEQGPRNRQKRLFGVQYTCPKQCARSRTTRQNNDSGMETKHMLFSSLVATCQLTAIYYPADDEWYLPIHGSKVRTPSVRLHDWI